MSLARVYAAGVYAVPAGMAPARGWADKCATLLASCKAFHEAQFPGSALEWVLHGPLYLSAPAARHRGKPDGFYGLLNAEVKSAAAAPGGLPPVARCSAAAGRGSTFLPTIVDFVCFADWGLETATPALLSKYFIGKAAGGIDIADITMAGGSRSSFQGRVTRRALAGLACWGRPAPPTLGTAAFWSATVGLGLGLVTQEAWYHPEVRRGAAKATHNAAPYPATPL